MLKNNDLNNYFSKNPKQLPPSDWAKITKLLIKSEASPGGPYFDKNGKINTELNFKIAGLLASQGINLPALTNFLKDKSKKDSGQAKKTTTTEKIKLPLNNKPTSLKDEQKLLKIRINKKIEAELNLLKTKTKNSISKNFKKLPPALKKIALKFWASFSSKEIISEIIGLPYYCYLAVNQTKKKNPNILKELVEANIYLWIAYTIYDNILDEEKDIELLPFANYCLKEHTSLLEKNIGNDQKLTALIKKISNLTDNAACAEVLNLPCRPEHKSLAHLAGGLIIFAKNGYQIDSDNFKKLFFGMSEYLKARQLSDDLKDLEDDWRAKRNNGLIKKGKTNLNLIKQPKFLITSERKILKIVRTSRKNLSASEISRPKIFERLLRPIETQGEKFLQQTGDIKKFFDTWKNSDKNLTGRKAREKI